MTLRALTLFAILTAIPFTIAEAQPPPNVQAEIEYLLQHIETSGCAFYRNGTWYEGARAREHLRTKYVYLAKRQLIATTEDFIDKAATKSSLSGKPYKIRCADNIEVESGPWLHQVLARYRTWGRTSGRASGQPQGPDGQRHALRPPGAISRPDDTVLHCG
jgi:hypothetical protein